MSRRTQMRLGYFSTSIIPLAVLIILSAPGFTVDYYVNPVTGSNGNDGLAPSTAWKTITPYPTYTTYPTYTDAPTCAPLETHAPGDLTGDGKADAEDLLELLNFGRQSSL